MIIYKTINKINGHYYIGKDQRNNPEYLGSGLLLKRAVEKYGRDNFIKEILEQCSDKDTLAEKEKYWISHYNAVQDPNSYNIHEGGRGGNTGAYHKVGKFGAANAMYGRKPKPESIEKSRISRNKWLESDEGLAYREAIRRRWQSEKNPGKNKSPETIQKIKKARKGQPALRYALYTLTSPASTCYKIYTKERLTRWCNENGHSIWTIERRLLAGIQPKSGTLTGWTATATYVRTLPAELLQIES